MENNTENRIYSVKSKEFQAIQLPNIREVRGKEYVFYGDRNLFPQELIELYDTSAMHHTSIQAIKDGIIGDGIEVIGDEFINSNGETIDDVFEKIALDYALFQGYAINVIWNKEGTRIVEIYHIPFANVRSGKMNEDDKIEEYFYSSNWKNLKKYPYNTYRSFNLTHNKKDNASQIYYYYNYTPGNEVYPLPTYIGALNDINLDARISVFHNSNISNGLQPSLFIKFNNGIPTAEERRDIYNDIDGTFSGENNAGRFFLSFADGAERQMDVQTIDAANDDYYLTVEERISSRILTAHRITSPMLLGIKDASGFSNNADEIIIAYKHFESTVVEPKRKKILTSFGWILKACGFNISLTVKPKSITIKETTVNEEQTNTI